MRKLILLGVSAVTFLIYYAGLSGEITRKILNISNRPMLLESNKYRYGDLYGMSYLSDFRILAAIDKTKKHNCEHQKDVHLYILGDSFLQGWITRTPVDSLFCNASHLTFLWFGRDSPKRIRLDSKKNNILVIEHTERLVRGIYNDAFSAQKVIGSFLLDTNFDFATQKKDISTVEQEPKESKSFLDNLFDGGIIPKTNQWFNPLINQNLEVLLFDYSLFTPVKELKANLNYRFFERTAPDVAVSGDEQWLFYRNTVDSTLYTSSFKALPDKELAIIIKNLNNVYHYYKSKGFDEVYFTIPPNSVSIIEPDRMNMSYNKLIERINKHLALEMPIIDVYTPIVEHTEPRSLYFRSDTHWNTKGFKVWLDQVNKILNSEVYKE